MVMQYPCVMGIINLSPDSFYQAIPCLDQALQKAVAMAEAGAAIVDVGAVATNPSTQSDASPTPQQEIDCLIPFIEKLKQCSDVMISVDTSDAEVMRAVIAAGAHMINDQRMLQSEKSMSVVARAKIPVCLMHHFSPVRKPDSSSLENLLMQIKDDLQQAAAQCIANGILREHIILDPGFGGGHFGKSARENFYLLAHLNIFVALGFPVLVGVSRKSMFADIKANVQDRLFASISAATIAAMSGAAILRVHDVEATMDAMRVVQKLRECRE